MKMSLQLRDLGISVNFEEVPPFLYKYHWPLKSIVTREAKVDFYTAIK